jgi:glycosyltransferase involved in cell wall biosynthesis
MRFSVILPAYNEAEGIGRSIGSLKSQNFPRETFEIIVVDNNSTDDTARVARASGADKVVVEKEKGTNIARERGFEESVGEIVAFLDADSVAPPDWLQKIEKSLSRDGIAAVSSGYDYGFKGLNKALSDFFDRFVLSHVGDFLYFIFRRKAGVIIGGNFASYRWAIEKIGGLPPLHFWGDDAAIAMLISRHAGKVLFDPDLTVKSSPRRFEKEGILKLELRYISAYLKVFFDPRWK